MGEEKNIKADYEVAYDDKEDYNLSYQGNIIEKTIGEELILKEGCLFIISIINIYNNMYPTYEAYVNSIKTKSPFMQEPIIAKELFDYIINIRKLDKGESPSFENKEEK